MSIFDLVNPFSYITPVYADDEEVDTPSEVAPVETSTAVVASDPVEETAADEQEEVEETEEEEEEAEEEEEEEEAEDHAPAIKEACSDSLACKSLKHHYEECAARVDDGSKESCAEELLHFMHCVDQCAVPKIFEKLK